MDARAKRKASEISTSSTGTDSGLSVPTTKKKRVTSWGADQVPPTRWSLRKFPASKSTEIDEGKEKGKAEKKPDVEVMVVPQEKVSKKKTSDSTAISMDPVGLTLATDFLSSEKVDECILPEADKLLLPVAVHRLNTLTTNQVSEVNVGHVLHVSLSLVFQFIFISGL